MKMHPAIRLLPALLILLAACSGTDERSAADKGLRPIDTAVNTQPVTVQWSVTSTGIGPIRVGMTLAQAREALNGALVVTDSTSPCFYVRPGRGPAGLSFMVTSGQIARIDIQDDSIATDAGARVGDNEERIKALYPDRIEVQPHKYSTGHYLIVTPQAGESRIIFETDGTTVTRYRAGKLPEVEWVEGCS